MKLSKLACMKCLDPIYFSNELHFMHSIKSKNVILLYQIVVGYTVTIDSYRDSLFIKIRLEMRELNSQCILCVPTEQ